MWNELVDTNVMVLNRRQSVSLHHSMFETNPTDVDLRKLYDFKTKNKWGKVGVQ
jgi:hypothetical protein